MSSANSTDPASVQNTTDNTVLNSTSARAVTLIVIMLAGLIGNVFVIAAIGSNKKLKTSAVYIFSLNIAVTNILDSILNMSIVLGATVANSWELGEVMCRLSSFFMMFQSIELTLSLTFMTLDRMIATKHWSKYDELQSIPRTCTMIAYTWIHSLAFSIPIAVGTIPSKVHSKIYACMISDATSFIYICILSISSFIIPLIITFTLLLVIIKTAYTERSAVRAMLAQHQYSRDIEEPKFCTELYAAKYVGILVCSWILLHLPYVVNLFFHLYKYSPVLNTNTVISVEYIWYCDTAVMWMKFSYVIVLPVLLFICNKDLWHTLRDVARCRKNNAVVDIVGKSDPKIREKAKYDEKNFGKEEKVKEAFTHNSGFQIPVLFATSNGVHIQTYDNDTESICYDHVIRGKKCDVIGSQDLLNQVASELETSDYDSGGEIDPFSVSHPVSSKNLNKNQTLAEQRSNSHPEVRSKTKIVNRNSDTLVSLATDSGLDISSGGNTLTLRTLRDKPTRQSQHSANEVLTEMNQTPAVNDDSETNIPHTRSHIVNQILNDRTRNEMSFVNNKSENPLANNETNNERSNMPPAGRNTPQFYDCIEPHTNCNKEEMYKCTSTSDDEGQNPPDIQSNDGRLSSDKYDAVEHREQLENDNKDCHELRSDDGLFNERSHKTKKEIQDSVNCNDNLSFGMHSKHTDSLCNIKTVVDNDLLDKTTKNETTDQNTIQNNSDKSPIKSTSNKKQQKKHGRKEKLHQTESMSATCPESQISGLLRPPARLEPLLNTRTLYSRLKEDNVESTNSDLTNTSVSEKQHETCATKFDAIRTLDENKFDSSPKKSLKERRLSGVTNLLLPDSPTSNNDAVVTPSACDIIDISKDTTEVTKGDNSKTIQNEDEV